MPDQTDQISTLDKPKLGIALGGGVARGWAHIGVLRALTRAGIEPDIVVGTSIGAVVGGCYLAGKLDAVESWARSINRLKAVGYLDFRMRKPGLIAGERLAREMHAQLGNVHIEDLPRPFACVTTDLVTGHEVWLTRGPLAEAIRASFSMPGVFPPMQIGGRWLVDGALVNPVPVSVCIALGARMVIGVNANGEGIRRIRGPGGGTVSPGGPLQPRIDVDDVVRAAVKAERAERGRWGTGLPGLAGLIRQILRPDRNTPSLFGVMVASLGIVLDRATRSRLAGEPPDIHIAPRIGHIGLAEFDRANELIDLGAKAGEAAVPDIREALALFGIPGSAP